MTGELTTAIQAGVALGDAVGAGKLVGAGEKIAAKAVDVVDERVGKVATTVADTGDEAAATILTDYHPKGPDLDHKDAGFSGGMPTLEGDAYSPAVVNGRSTQSYSGYGDNPVRGTMSDVEARKWYLDQDSRILESIDSAAPLEVQARQAFDLRNANRTNARELMADRISADRLYREEPNWTWEQMIDHRKASGLSEQQIYESIIESAQKTRSSVNKQLGLE